MIFKHKIQYYLTVIWCLFLTLYPGRFVYQYLEEKDKNIKGVITGFAGCSVTQETFVFDIQIKWFEPRQGTDYRFYSDGAYFLKDFKAGKLFF